MNAMGGASVTSTEACSFGVSDRRALKVLTPHTEIRRQGPTSQRSGRTHNSEMVPFTAEWCRCLSAATPWIRGLRVVDSSASAAGDGSWQRLNQELLRPGSELQALSGRGSRRAWLRHGSGWPARGRPRIPCILSTVRSLQRRKTRRGPRRSGTGTVFSSPTSLPISASQSRRCSAVSRLHGRVSGNTASRTRLAGGGAGSWPVRESAPCGPRCHCPIVAVRAT